MKKLMSIFLLFSVITYADTHDMSYTCIAFQKNRGDKAKRLDMKQSLAKGGWFSLSLKVNFLYGIVSRNKDTINNIEFEDLRFAYRDSFLSYNLYVYDYNKDYFLIEKGDKTEPHFSIKVKDGNTFYYKCMLYRDNNFKKGDND